MSTQNSNHIAGKEPTANSPILKALKLLGWMLLLASFIGSVYGIFHYSTQINDEGVYLGEVTYATARIRILETRINAQLSALEIARRDRLPAADALQELSGTADRATVLFQAFISGGEVKAITGHVTPLRPVATEKGMAAAKDLQATWFPLRDKIQTLIQHGEPLDAGLLADARRLARESGPKIDKISEILAHEEAVYYRPHLSSLLRMRSILIAYLSAASALLIPVSLLLGRIRKFNVELEAKVKGRTTELRATNESLQSEIAERQRAEEEIQALNAGLELRVKERTQELAESEKRFRTIYDTAPVSIWQEDWTEVIESIEDLQIRGVTDFPTYFREHPEFVARALKAVKVRDVNQWTLGTFAARDKAEMLASLGPVFATPDKLPGFVGELTALAQGQTVYHTEMNLNTVKGDTMHGLLATSFPPRGSGSGDVLVSVLDITERQRAEIQIQHLNEQLKARAQALVEANKELETFSYSVSHDLRAPLRIINGLSSILLEGCTDKLGTEGKESLLAVISASQQMSELIDDLLQLSRITRSEVRRAPVDLSALARSVADELRKANPERCVELLIEPDLMTQADARLMRIVLQNLFGNAWKFTSQKCNARIEFGRSSHNGVAAYFVRDNGAGFDMAYANKLFGAFQRLHSTAEFPGTGVGLATVQRVIHRHGGQVWAEGEIDRGATFYFTLPSKLKAR
ncbi:MAG: histidine kinase [Pedosphaera sp.]|nr:histidine kinase [Pedosphaera sp.]